MFRVAWWLLLGLACCVAVAVAWSSLGLPRQGLVLEGLAFYSILYAVVAAFTYQYLGESWVNVVPLRGVPLSSVPLKITLAAALMALGTFVLAYQAVTFCLDMSVVDPAALAHMRGGASGETPSFLTAIVSQAVLPPVFEEALFRGLVLQALAATMSKRSAVVISALYFAAMHGQIERVPDTFLLGLLYGWVFVRTGSLLPSMLAHALHNGLGVWIDRTQAPPGTDGSPIQVDHYGLLPTWMVAAAIVAVGLGVWLVPKTHLWPEDPRYKSPEELDEEAERLAA